MSSLLSPFSFGQQKQSYFQVKLTIHELNSVPLVTGYFHVKWRFKNVHSISATAHHASSQLGKGHSLHHHHHHDQSHRSSPKSTKSASLKGSPEKKSVALPNDRDAQGEMTAATNANSSNGKGKEREIDHEEHQEELNDDVNGNGNDEDREDGVEGSKRSSKKSKGRFLSGMANALHLKRHQDSDDHQVDSIPNQEPDTTSKGEQGSSSEASEAQQDQPKSASTTSSFPSITTDESSRNSFASSRHTFDSENEKTQSSKGKGKEKSRHHLDSHHSQSHQHSSHSPNNISSSQPHKPNSHKHSNHSNSNLNQNGEGGHSEPRGETNSARVYEHKVIWERSIETGIRINVEKPRVASGSSSKSNTNDKNSITSPTSAGGLESSSNSIQSEKEKEKHGNSGGGLSSKSSSKDLRNRKENDSLRESKDSINSNHMSLADDDEAIREAWGYLANSELRLSVKQHVDADTPNSASDVPHRLGFVVLNLAEYAPQPPSKEHHHHHYHHHHHHHHHSTASHNIPPHAPSRSETRRYLLQESKTNATLKLTIEMTYIGGAREYNVPSLKRGFAVGGLGGLVDETKGIGGDKKRKKHSSNSNSEGSENGSLLNGIGGSNSNSRNQSSTSLNHYNQNSKSTTSLSNQNSNGVGFRSGSIFSSKNPSSQARIPLSNLKTSSSSKSGEAKNKTRDANLSFNFQGANNHDRSPESIIEAIFNPGPASNATLMLGSTVSRSEKVKPEKRSKNDHGQLKQNPSPALLYPIQSIESGSSSQESIKDGKSTGKPQRPEMKRSLSEKNNPSSSLDSSFSHSSSSNYVPKSNNPSRSHHRSTSASTMRSILTNSGASSYNQEQSPNPNFLSPTSSPHQNSSWSSSSMTNKDKNVSVRWSENPTNSIDSSSPSASGKDDQDVSNSLLLGSVLNSGEVRKVLTSSPDPLRKSQGNSDRPETPTIKDRRRNDGNELEIPSGLTLPDSEITPKPQVKT